MSKELVEALDGDEPSPSQLGCVDGFGLVDNLNYLNRCQVDTPQDIVQLMWAIVARYRTKVGAVLDAGAGDGRFALAGDYGRYVGYEIDPKRLTISGLPANAEIKRSDVFADPPTGFDLALGNPPYVRHHDLGEKWRAHVSSWIERKAGVRPNGWSNAYLYFLWLALLATKDDGLIVYLLPFDWVARPAAKTLREFIASPQWKVDIYRFDKDIFDGVLTTACVAVVDKSQRGGTSYFRINEKGVTSGLSNPTLTEKKVLEYSKAHPLVFARRGLSPGHQKVFLLTEDERLANGLRVGEDVVCAVTSFKDIDKPQKTLTERFFEKHFIDNGSRCWLVNVSSDHLSGRLERYLARVGGICKDNTTCSKRQVWWKFEMPAPPQILYASGFRGPRPKAMINEIGAVAVGSVCGVYAETKSLAHGAYAHIQSVDFASQVVSMSRGFTKVEINQMNSVLQQHLVSLGLQQEVC